MILTKILWPEALFEAAYTCCESPIEQKLFEAIVAHPYFAGGEVMTPWMAEAGYVAPEGIQAMLLPQADVIGYRADMLIMARGYRTALDATVIECDGHDFHERTKAQARHDRQRDRRMMGQGYNVRRFTGQEIHMNAAECADEIWRGIAQRTGWLYEGDVE